MYPIFRVLMPLNVVAYYYDMLSAIRAALKQVRRHGGVARIESWTPLRVTPSATEQRS